MSNLLEQKAAEVIKAVRTAVQRAIDSLRGEFDEKIKSIQLTPGPAGPGRPCDLGPLSRRW